MIDLLEKFLAIGYLINVGLLGHFFLVIAPEMNSPRGPKIGTLVISLVPYALPALYITAFIAAARDGKEQKDP